MRNAAIWADPTLHSPAAAAQLNGDVAAGNSSTPEAKYVLDTLPMLFRSTCDTKVVSERFGTGPHGQQVAQTCRTCLG